MSRRKGLRAYRNFMNKPMMMTSNGRMIAIRPSATNMLGPTYMMMVIMMTTKASVVRCSLH